MKIKKEHVVAGFFLLCLLFFNLGILYQSGIPYGEFKAQYRDIATKNQSNGNVFVKLENATKAYEKTIETSMFITPLIEVNGLYQNILGKRTLQDAGYGEIYKTKSGQIIFGIKKLEEEVAFAAEKTIWLHKELEKAGIPSVYIQAPFKLCHTEGELPRTKVDFSDENIDSFLEKIGNANVPMLDLRPLLLDGEKEMNELFFKTDHHWRIETAFDATCHIERHLNKKFNFSIDPFFMDEKNYQQDIYPQCFLGSMGRRTGMLYAGLDDFTLVTPSFETNLTLQDIADDGSALTHNGSFQDILRMEYLDNPYNVYKNRYGVYYGDNRELIFNNHLVNNGKILIIKDSFGVPVYSFLSLGVSEVRALDIRFFKESILDYAKAYQPDVVIVLYNGDIFSHLMFDFK